MTINDKLENQDMVVSLDIVAEIHKQTCETLHQFKKLTSLLTSAISVTNDRSPIGITTSCQFLHRCYTESTVNTC